MTLKTGSIIGLVGLSIVDMVIPIPILGMMLIFIVLQRPPWFHKAIRELYEV